MELTIEQALQQGMAAHNQGNIQEAESIYRAILQSQPTHPDANHNLGLIAMSVNQSVAALPLFKIALDIHPEIEQYWLSYINALVKEKQFDNAKRALKKANKKGVSGEKFDILKTQLAFKNKIKDVSSVSPSLKELSSLLDQHYVNGQHADAEEVAIYLTQGFPEHQFGWKVLGALYGQSGRNSEAITANKAAIALSPQDADAHYNLGITYQKLGRLQEAEASYTQAIALKPDDAEAYNNLGVTLKELGRLDEAEAINRQTIGLKPDYAEAHGNLGNTLEKLGRLEQAEISYRQAIALKPDFAEAHNNLGNTLKALSSMEDSEACYRQAISLKSDYAEAHNNLGVMLRELNRLDEAEASLRQAIALKYDYAYAHYNLGNTFKDLGRLDESEASYRQAIAIKPDFAECHNNLGHTLNELGRLDEAEAIFMQAIALNPDLSDAQNNFGITLQKLGRLDEASASYRRAIASEPGLAEAHHNLGDALQKLGRLDESVASSRQAIALKANYAEAMRNLSTTLDYMNDLESEIVALQNLLTINRQDYELMAGVNLAICHFLENNFSESKKHLLATAGIQEKEDSNFFHNEKVYQRYLIRILNWHEEKHVNGCSQKTEKILYVVGDGHSLVSHQLHIQNSGAVMLCKANLIKGCKQWDLGNSLRNQYKYKFENVFCSLPKSSEVLIAIGEIDCRPDGGIIKYKSKFPEKTIKEIIETTVDNFLTYISKNNSDRCHNITIQGVLCPNIDPDILSEERMTQLIEVIKTFNCELQSMSKKKGFGFLDVHKLTDRGDGFSNALWHIDDFHLTPDGVLEAWRTYAAE